MAFCRVQSAIPALWLPSAIPALWIRFGTLHQCCINFLSRIFYPFWAPHSRKLRIGLFHHCATKTWVWSFWGATGLNFQNFDLERTPHLYANGPGSFPPGFFTPFWRPMAGNYESIFLTIVQPNGAFDRHTTKIYVRSFWPLCDQERPQKSATNSGLKCLASVSPHRRHKKRPTTESTADVACPCIFCRATCVNGCHSCFIREHSYLNIHKISGTTPAGSHKCLSCESTLNVEKYWQCYQWM